MLNTVDTLGERWQDEGMPPRMIPLVTGEVYHVVNRSVGKIPIFTHAREYQRFVNAFGYYQNAKLPYSFSRFLELPVEERLVLKKKLAKNANYVVDILVYCLMPTHFHFLLKQIKDDGIKDFIRLLANSYSKYFNTRHQRRGSLFMDRFKGIRIETDEQLMHVSRYIHLNPYSGLVMTNVEDLLKYRYSSFLEYMGLDNLERCQKDLVLGLFRDKDDYRNFVLDQADYQRSLELIKHQLLDK